MNPKPLIASHTFLDCFESCPKRAFHRYIVKDIPFVETEQMKWGTQVHTAFEKRVRDKTPLPGGMTHFEQFASPLDAYPCQVERKLGMDAAGKVTGFFAPNVWCRGKVDIAVVKGGTALILDWKTGKPREDPAELDRFAYLLRATYDDVEKFVGRYVWLKEGKIGEKHDLEPDKRLQADRRLMEQAEALKKRGDPWPANQNGLCRAYCEVFSCPFNGRHS